MRQSSRLDWKYILIALALAAITYAYLNRMIQKTAESQDSSYKLIKLTAKTVPVHVRVASSAPAGYRIVDQRITVEPSRVTVVGPEALLEDASVAETAIIDVGQATHKITKSIPLESIAGVHLGGEPMFVDVTIPIEKLEEAR
ncbi:MAG: YbbR-like domain-containing protein [Candidatus Omnitrophica bacterium]|nr:YbbR-like domain-containing protein [Candidatus Omnitrophota bacterium]